jgi:hypothetical protein
MTAPTLPTTTAKLGPGTLTIGEVGSSIDVACLVNGARIAATKNQTDPTTKLCGTVRPGSTSYTYEFTGNIDTDIADAAGLFALSQSAAGTEQPFTFVPNTEAGTEASGVLILDPLDFGADEYGADLTSDFTFAIVGTPAYTFPTGEAGT